MKSDFQMVLSASRRTDIPAFYMPWFMDRIEKGAFEVINPINGKKTFIPADPGRIHTIVFWSKNYGPFLDGRHGETLREKGYHLFFNFTVNSEDDVLEPKVPSLAMRLTQLAELCERFGPRSIQWRFDPICHFQDQTGRVRNNLEDFMQIAETASTLGVNRCVTSFMDPYQKVRLRAEACKPPIVFMEPSLEKKMELVARMQERLRPLHIRLFTCCEKEVSAGLPEGKSVSGGACIPNDYLMELYGGRLSLQRDRGQRVKSGCGCMVSRDIGSYGLHVCGHRCLYCYANPEEIR